MLEKGLQPRKLFLFHLKFVAWFENPKKTKNLKSFCVKRRKPAWLHMKHWENNQKCSNAFFISTKSDRILQNCGLLFSVSWRFLQVTRALTNCRLQHSQNAVSAADVKSGRKRKEENGCFH